LSLCTNPETVFLVVGYEAERSKGGCKLLLRNYTTRWESADHSLGAAGADYRSMRL